MLPRFVYLMSLTENHIVFEHGVRRHGENMSLEDHITGASNYQMIENGHQPNDGYISTQFTMLDATNIARPFINPGNLPAGLDHAWVYEIRPTQDFYELERTADNFLNYLNTHHIEFPDQARREELYNIFGNFVSTSLASEWFSITDIPGTLIRRAFRVNLRHYVLGRPDVDIDNPINNPNYINSPANPNANPYERENLVNPTSSNHIVIVQDFGGGYISASISNVFDRSFGLNSNLKKINYLPIPKANYNKVLKKDLANFLIIDASKPKGQDLPLINIESGGISGNLWLQETYAICNTTGAQDWHWVYDQDGCIGFFHRDNPFLFYCLTAGSVDGTNWQYIGCWPKVENDKTQQWDLIPSSDKKYLTLSNKKYPKKVVGVHYVNFRNYLTIRDVSAGKSLIKINFEKLANKDILNRENVNNTLTWFDLRWAWDGKTYYPSLSGSSYQKHEDAEILYFKEFSYIIYIQISTGKMYALTNKRETDDDWNWIKWEEITYKEFLNRPVNPRRMWKISKVDDRQININNYWNDDILWVQTHSTNWGSYFTSRKTSDYYKTSSKNHLAEYYNYKENE